MIASDIISKFEIYTDDSTELSSTEELDLLNDKYQEVCAEKPWEFLKKNASGTLSGSVTYVALPADFGYVYVNRQTTDIAVGQEYKTSAVVFVNGTAFQIVNWSDRNQYTNQSGFAYVDIVNSRMYFTKQPNSGDTYSYDYISVPAALESDDEPIFPSQFHKILVFGMATDDMIIQLFDKARSYRKENLDNQDKYFKRMSFWNANMLQN